jgi:hypothetical protein
MHFQTFCTRRNLLNRSGSKRCLCVSLKMRPSRKARGVDWPTYCPHVDPSMFHSRLYRSSRDGTLLPLVEVTFGDLRAHQQEGDVWVYQENGIRPRNIGSRRRLLLAFSRCIGLLDPRRPSATDRLPFVTHVLLVPILIAMMHGLGHAQAPVDYQDAIISSSTAAHDEAGDNQSTSIYEASNQGSAKPCRLQGQYSFPQSSANATEAAGTFGTLDYTPFSARCKFNLFLKQTHSPYTFVSAGFLCAGREASLPETCAEENPEDRGKASYPSRR